jgi:hypothetical protein
MKSYEAARSLFSFLAFISWSVVAVGVIVALVSVGSVSQYAGSGAGMLAMIPGIGIGITGFILVAFVQMGRASVDTAEYTQQMLKVSRDQLEVSRQSSKLAEHQHKSFASVTSQPEPKTGFERANFDSPSESKNEQKKTAFIAAPTPPMLEGEQLEYMGQTITHKSGMFLVGAQSFSSLNHAKNCAEMTTDLHNDRTK